MDNQETQARNNDSNLGTDIDLSYLDPLKEEYNSIKDKGRDIVFRFLYKNKYLTHVELSYVVGVTLRVIERFRKRYGLVRRIVTESYDGLLSVQMIKKQITKDRKADIPNEWVVQEYCKGSGSPTISKVTGTRFETIIKTVQRAGVHTRPKHEHPCHNKEWLIKHYIEYQGSVTKIAKLAGVSKTKIDRWLDGFKIKNRSLTPYWANITAKLLKRRPIVSKVVVRRGAIEVEYKTGASRAYVFDSSQRRMQYGSTAISMETAKVGDPVDIGYQFPWQLWNRPDLKKYFLVSHTIYNKLNILDREILIQEILYRLRDYIQPYHTLDEIKADLREIRRDYNPHYSNVFWTPSCKPGRAIIETYVDLQAAANADKPSRTMRIALQDDQIIRSIIIRLTSTKRDITINNIFDVAHHKKHWSRYINPGVWKAIIRDLFDPAGRVISDATPNVGEKAIATAFLYCSYAPLGNSLDSAKARGMADIGIKFVDPPQHHDILLVDNNMYEQDVNKWLGMLQQCNEMLLFVTQEQYQRTIERYKPHRAVRIGGGFGPIGYLLVYKQ